MKLMAVVGYCKYLVTLGRQISRHLSSDPLNGWNRDRGGWALELLVGVAAGALHPFVCGCATGGLGMSATYENDSCGELVHRAQRRSACAMPSGRPVLQSSVDLGSLCIKIFIIITRMVK
jgi:hypothetical protein